MKQRSTVNRPISLINLFFLCVIALLFSCTTAHSDAVVSTQSVLVKAVVALEPEERGPTDSVRSERIEMEEALPDQPLAEAATFVRNQQYGDAVILLTKWIEWEPDHADTGLGRTLLGKLLFEQGKYAKAKVVLADNVDVPYTVADLHAYLYGEVLRGTGHPIEAIPHFEKVTTFLRSPLAPKAGFRVADSLFEAKHFKKALSTYGSMLKQYPEYPGQPTVRLRIARCHELLGRKASAARRYRGLHREAPTANAGTAAFMYLEALRKDGVRLRPFSFENQLEWAIDLRRDRKWARAKVELEQLVKVAPNREKRAEIYFHLGLAAASLEHYEEALAAFQKAKRSGNYNSSAVRHQIKTLRKMGRTEDAVIIARRIAGKNRKYKDLAAAEIYIDDGLYKKGRKLYRRYHRKSKSVEVRWKLAWLDYRTGHYKAAARAFSGLRFKKNFRTNKVAYWFARTRMKQGLSQEATEEFTKIVRANPTGYYGMQAANRILDMGNNALYRKLTDASLEDLPSVTQRTKEGGSIRWRGADGTTSKTQAPDKPNAQALLETAKQYGKALPELWRAYDRNRMGLDEDARLELRTARAELRRARKGPARLLAKRQASLFMDLRRHKRGLWGSRVNRVLKLGWRARKQEEARIKSIKKLDKGLSEKVRELLANVGDYYWTRKNAYSSHWRSLRGVPESENLHIFKNAYPMVYEDILRRDTTTYALSPFLMASMARVESGFNELAVSPAGARGLLQVMPVTGNLIAGRRGDTEFAAADLLNPRVSIDYGTWYMDQLLYKFRGQEPLAVISYNAGPHRVQAWLARRGDKSQLDEFIEEVPYREARRYVKRVLQYVGMYRRIYDDRADLYVGQKLDPRFKSNINW